MREPLAFLMRFRVVTPVFAIVWSGITLAQGPPPFDKHVGGDVPIDEQLAIRRNRSRVTPLPEDRVIKNGVLAPSKEDRTTLESFLRMPNTGLMRLLPPGSVTYRRGSQLIPGDGAYYSFANIAHFLGYGTDIELKRGQLSIPSMGFGYGFMTNLGDVPLEEIELSNFHTKFISDYRPAVTILEARAEALRFRNPVTIDGAYYKDLLPVEVGSTYLLRSISYKKRIFGSNGSPGAVNNPHETDVLVAFRVVRKDTDASVIIAWKLLKKYSPPKLD